MSSSTIRAVTGATGSTRVISQAAAGARSGREASSADPVIGSAPRRR